MELHKRMKRYSEPRELPHLTTQSYSNKFYQFTTNKHTNPHNIKTVRKRIIKLSKNHPYELAVKVNKEIKKTERMLRKQEIKRKSMMPSIIATANTTEVD